MGEGNARTRRQPLFRTIFLPGVFIAAINLAAMSLLQKFYSGTNPLYLSTPIRDGGLSFSPRAIGTLESISATVIGLSQLFVFPRVHHKWGSRYVFVLGLYASVPQVILWPLMNWIARRDGYSGLVWLSLGSQICCSVLTEFALRKSFNIYHMQCRSSNITNMHLVAIWVLITQSYGSHAAVAGFCHVCYLWFLLLTEFIACNRRCQAYYAL